MRSQGVPTIFLRATPFRIVVSRGMLTQYFTSRFAEPEQRNSANASSSQYARKPVSPRPSEQYGRLSPQPPASGQRSNSSYSQPSQQYAHTMSPPPNAGPRPPVLQNRPPPVSRPPPTPAPPSPNQDQTLLPLFRAVDKNGELLPC